MSSKTRGRYENINSSLTTSIISQQQYVPSLLKIESVVPTRNQRSHHANKLIYRSYSTLGNTTNTTNYKNVSKSKINTNLHRHKAHASKIEQPDTSKDPVEVNGSQIDNSIIVENGVYKIRRSVKERDKQPDRINLDRRGLSAIPLIESEPNLRLLSLQHNFINVFHVPVHDRINEGHEDVEKADTNNNVCRTDNETRSILSGHTNITNGNYSKLGNPNKPFLKQKSMSRHQLNVNTVGKTASPTSFQKSYLLQNKPASVLKKSNSLMINNYTPQASTPSATTNLMLFKNKLIATPSFSHEANSTDSNNCALQIAAICSPVTVIRSNFSNLVFLDLYNNQIEKIDNLNGLKSLTVLLLGKNRISDISGIVALKQLRVLDLHGNKIANVSNKISQLQELKSLNLAGNLLTKIIQTDFAGLFCLKELNLKRNKIKKLSGFTDLTQLERLWLCNNELPSIEDMQSLAKSVNLKEITIENNPISLAGDCVSFLVSYLPLLVSLNQMQITEQVRRAANAWRKSKENSDKNYQHLTSDVCSNIRREEIISNARTNWELIRSQQSNIINGRNSRDIIKPAPKPNNVSVTVPSQKYSSSSSNSTVSSSIQQENGMNRNNKVANGGNAKKPTVDSLRKINRSSSQENTGSGSMFSEQDNEPDEYFHLPPILTPFLEPQKNPSASSMRPNVDSGSSACSSDIEDKKSPKKKSSIPTTPPIFVSLPPSPFELRITTDEDVGDKPTSYTPPLPCVEPDIFPIPVKAKSPVPHIIEDEVKSKPKELKEKPTLTIVDNFNGMSLQPVAENNSKPSVKHSGYNSPRVDQDMDKLSTLTQNSTAKNSSDSINTIISSVNEAASSNFSSHSAKKQVHNKRHHMQLVRAQTARNLSVNHTSHLQNQVPINQANNQAKLQQNSNKIDKDREQGGDFLVEICGRYLNVYGNGALKFVDKPWNVQKANDVHTVKFSYINFNSITPILCRIKPRFQNVEHYVFRGNIFNLLYLTKFFYFLLLKKRI